MKYVKRSFYRYIGYFLAILLISNVLSFILNFFGIKPRSLLLDDAYALNSGYSSGQYYVAFQDCGNMSSGTSCAAGFGTWFGPSNYGTAIQNPHNQSSSTYPFIYNQTRYQFRFSGGSTYTYKKGNEYNVKIKFRTTYDSLSSLSTFWKVDHIFGSTTGSSSSQSETYVKLISYILNEDSDLSTTNTYVLDVKFIPTRDINYFSIYYSLIDTSSRFITSYGFGGNMITYDNIPITYVEDADIAVKDAINTQTDAMNKGFTEIENIINQGNNAVNNTLNIINNSQNETNDLIKDDSIDSSSGSDFFDSIETNQHGITAVLTAPLSFIQSFATETCSPISASVFGSDFTIPCMKQKEIAFLGQDFYNIIVILVNGPLVYAICTYFVKSVKHAQDPDDDRIEVAEL